MPDILAPPCDLVARLWLSIIFFPGQQVITALPMYGFSTFHVIRLLNHEIESAAKMLPQDSNLLGRSQSWSLGYLAGFFPTLSLVALR